MNLLELYDRITTSFDNMEGVSVLRYQDEEEFYNEEFENEQAEKKAERKKKRFRLFNSQREGKGVEKEEANLPTNFVGFWKRYRRDWLSAIETRGRWSGHL